jgi:hypothetical protein
MLVFAAVFAVVIAGCCAQSDADLLCISQCLSAKEIVAYDKGDSSLRPCEYPALLNKLQGCLMAKANCASTVKVVCAGIGNTEEELKEIISFREEICKTEYSSFRSACNIKSSTAIIIGAVVGAVVLIGAVVGGVIFMKRRSAANVKNQLAPV